MIDNRTTSLVLSMKPDRVGEFFPLLQQGVLIEAHVGCGLDILLSQEWDVPPDYAARRITTIFLNGRPVDNLATTLIRENDVLALSGAMPGLVGATMRRGGFYAAMREGITHHDTAIDVPERLATLHVKLFNLLLPELGPGFLRRGIIVSASELSGFIQSRSEFFWQGCIAMLLDTHPVSTPAVLRAALFPAGTAIRLSVDFSSS